METGDVSVEIPGAKLEETRRQIEREMESSLQKFRNSEDWQVPGHLTEEEYEEQVRMGYSSGFKKWLPYSPYRKIFTDNAIASNNYDIPEREVHPEESSPLEIPAGLDEQWRNHSSRYLNQSMRQFYETIDKAVEAEGISDEEIKELVEGSFEGKISRVEFDRHLLPVYIRLRAMGYTKRDFGT